MHKHTSEYETKALLKKIHDQEQHIQFLHRQQRNLRFLIKRLVAELRIRINKRANLINSRHLQYGRDDRVKKLLLSHNIEDILSKIKVLDQQNIRLQRVSLVSRLRPLFWVIAAKCLNITIGLARGLKHHVK